MRLERGQVVQAELIAVGSEFLLEGRPDTNSIVLTEALAALGVEVRFKCLVGDDTEDIASAVRTACRRVSVVVLTGGLGPTADDRTREGVARALGRPLQLRADAVRAIRQRLRDWGRKVRAPHLRQGRIPRGAEMLLNPLGSAPGFILRWRGTLLCAIPGVPGEASRMFESEVAPRLAATLGSSANRAVLTRRALHTFGLTESEVEARVRALMPQRLGIRLGLLAAPLGVTVTLTAVRPASPRGRSWRADPRSVLDRLVPKLRARLAPYVYAEGTDTMEEVVGRQLSTLRLTLSVAESCTGGLIGHRLTQVPGSSAYVDRGIICYHDSAKEEWLGVPRALLKRHGAVSREVAGAMACGVRRRSRTDLGLAVTGIAGPGGATEHKPVGLVYVALDAKRGLDAALVGEYRFHGDRHMIKLRASQAALDLLRRYLAEAAGAGSR